MTSPARSISPTSPRRSFHLPLEDRCQRRGVCLPPLVHDGNIIDGFHFVVKDGKIVEAHARQGEETLAGCHCRGRGAAYFRRGGPGAPMTVPSPTRRSCSTTRSLTRTPLAHIAFGEAYPVWRVARR